MPGFRFDRRHAARRPLAAPRALAESLEDRRLLSREQFFIDQARDTVFDAGRNLLFVTTGTGVVERIDLATMARLTPWAVGTSLNGADITPDRSALFVTEGGRYADDPTTEGPDGILHKVDLATGAVTDIVYPIVGFQEGLGWDAQVAYNGKVYVTSAASGSTTIVPLLEVDGASGGTTRRQDVQARTGALLARSADRRTITIDGVSAWDVATGTVTDLARARVVYGSPVSRDGRLFAVGTAPPDEPALRALAASRRTPSPAPAPRRPASRRPARPEQRRRCARRLSGRSIKPNDSFLAFTFAIRASRSDRLSLSTPCQRRARSLSRKLLFPFRIASRR